MRVVFERFYITWYSRAKYFAREYVFSEEDAENITQDVFLDLYQKEILSDDQINQIAYLFTAIKNRCMDHLRRKLLEQETAQKLQKEHDLSIRLKFDTLEAFDTYWGSEEKLEKIIQKAINTLPERCKEIFIKSKIEGKKQKEIADELGISLKTIENQMTIAYKKLREELKEYLPLLLLLFF